MPIAQPRPRGRKALDAGPFSAEIGSFRHHFSHTWLDRGGSEGDLMELNGWSSSQMLRRYGASARSARARRTYDRIWKADPDWRCHRGGPDPCVVSLTYRCGCGGLEGSQR